MDTKENRRRLFALDENLRAEADLFLKESSLGEVIRKEGYHPVGSYLMHTMTWLDLDFDRYNEDPDWNEHWALGTKLAKLPWVWRLAAINAYIDPRKNQEGHYWGIRASRPGEKEFWKLDLWTARQKEFEASEQKLALWQSLLNDDSRYEILVIKEAVCNLPEYRQNLLSIHIYEAVLERGIRGLDAFWQWWKKEKAARNY
jgi:hypothetical protein